MTIIRTCVRKSVQSNDNGNILSFLWDGAFDHDVSLTGYTQYGYKKGSIYDYHNMSPYSNIQWLIRELSYYGHPYEFDCIICNDRITQYDRARELSYSFHVPMILIDHATPNKALGSTEIAALKEHRKAHYLAVGCHDIITKSWDCNETIPYGITVPDISFNEGKTNDILIVGKFLAEEYNIIHEIQQNFPSNLVFGDNPGLSKSFKNWKECEWAYLNSKVYVNLATNTSLPRGLLLAMSHGCSIVSNKTPIIDAYLNSDNCVFVRNVEDIQPAVIKLLQDTDTRKELFKNIRETTKTQFPLQPFIDKWTPILNKAKQDIFIP